MIFALSEEVLSRRFSLFGTNTRSPSRVTRSETHRATYTEILATVIAAPQAEKKVTGDADFPS